MGVIKILFIEDVGVDLELIKRAILKCDILFSEKVVVTENDFIEALTSFKPDIILSDYVMPGFTGLEALNLRKQISPDIPFILVTGSNNEETAVKCMREGADDYILKDNMTRLGQAIQAALNKYDFIRSKKEAEDALYESEELFRSAFENAAIGVYMINTEAIFINVNSTFCNIMGYSKEEILYTSLMDITWHEDKDITRFYLEQLKSGQSNKVTFEKRYIHKSGHIIWGDISTNRIHSPKNNSTYYVSYIQDITERKKYEEELLKAKEKAEESDRLKTAFLQNISHEIRTPMNAIVGFAGFLNNPKLNPEKRKHFTQVITQSSNQLLSIITDIITIATIEAGQEKVFPSDFRINSVLKLLYAQYGSAAQKKDIIFSYACSLPDTDDMVISDEIKVEEILSNLIGNAIKFTKNGKIEFGYSIKGDFIEFYVSDSGIGIVNEMHEEIFKRFRQVEVSEKRHYGGSGLGLSISKAYVELLGGKMWLTSETDKGSTFYFTIPYKKVFMESPSDEVLSDLSELSKYTLTALIAEDEDSNYMYLEELFCDWQINIIRAVNGNEAIEICRSEQNIDFVLMDIKMPEVDGIEATRKIKAINPLIPVIIQSAYSFPEEKNQAYLAGCSKFLSKPIHKLELFQAINQALETRLRACQTNNYLPS